MAQSHNQRGVNFVQEAIEPVAYEHGRMSLKFRPLAAVEAGEDQQRALFCMFAETEATLN